MRPSSRLLSTIAAALLAPGAALAHGEAGHATGFAAGLSHPISGLDHVLAMVLVGVLAYQLGGKALWAVPTAFLGLMGLGGALGAAGLPLPYVETGIALSVIVLGAIVTLGVKAPIAVAAGVVGLFALFHGTAHGAEMPETAAGLGYAAGFLLSTAILHLAGLGLGAVTGAAERRTGPLLTRTAGAVATLAGLGMLTGAL
jgi:urease accessory protein